ncbi:MAG: hypothetical protein GEU28_02140 [Dehalococcoidia bacterium]|nr:hypothetical protein [Dehalococcoidia bacterium]
MGDPRHLLWPANNLVHHDGDGESEAQGDQEAAIGGGAGVREGQCGAERRQPSHGDERACRGEDEKRRDEATRRGERKTENGQ